MATAAHTDFQGPLIVAKAGERLQSIDILRGLVMVIMALDHFRDFFSSANFSPTDLSSTTVMYFLTRWITHFCAPVFVFLAGTSAYLALMKGKSRKELARFLVTRGLWLIVVEFVIVAFVWNFSFLGPIYVQVIWVIGVSMIVLGGLIYLPLPAIAAFGLLMIALHHLLDGIQAQDFGSLALVWAVLHQPYQTGIGGIGFAIIYPLIPWVGVMAIGYAFGVFYLRSATDRRKLFLTIGLAVIALFVIVRYLNIYGDPNPWQGQDNIAFTLLSFLNTTKYPASLLFLLMTLGPAILLLVAFESWSGRIADFLLVFGRVPLFFYIFHIFLGHVAMIAAGMLQGFEMTQMLGPFWAAPGEYGFGLPGVYLIWAGLVLLLYPLCKWYAGVKRRYKHPLLSYL